MAHLLCTQQLLPDAEAGRAYAFAIELPAGQSAAQVSATFYQAKDSKSRYCLKIISIIYIIV